MYSRTNGLVLIYVMGINAGSFSCMYCVAKDLYCAHTTPICGILIAQMQNMHWNNNVIELLTIHRQ